MLPEITLWRGRRSHILLSTWVPEMGFLLSECELQAILLIHERYVTLFINSVTYRYHHASAFRRVPLRLFGIGISLVYCLIHLSKIHTKQIGREWKIARDTTRLVFTTSAAVLSDTRTSTSTWFM
jgi:hypothetical protein